MSEDLISPDEVFTTLGPTPAGTICFSTEIGIPYLAST